MSDPNALPAEISMLRCLKCGKSTDSRLDDLMRFVRTGWPKCCGDVMTVFTPVPHAEIARALSPPT